MTGAGISTSVGIPDFRGPNGIWTLQARNETPPPPKVTFVHAIPSLTHMALVALVRCGKVPFVTSQNVDGLHLRSGLAKSTFADLHGNCFAEHCVRCKRQYYRDFEIETVGYKPTGRRCSRRGCRGHLVDSILDWSTPLPGAPPSWCCVCSTASARCTPRLGNLYAQPLLATLSGSVLKHAAALHGLYALVGLEQCPQCLPCPHVP